MGQSSSSSNGRSRYRYSSPRPPPPPALPPNSMPSSSPPEPLLPPAVPYPAPPPQYHQPPPGQVYGRYPSAGPQYYVPPSRLGSWWVPPTPTPQLVPPMHYAHLPPPPVFPPPTPPPYVEHQRAKTVKNDVNVHKDSVRLVPDSDNSDQLLVSFTFDALSDGSVTIYYFAKEGVEGEVYPSSSDMYTPRKLPFSKGLGQKFIQPSGSGIDLGFYELDELAQPSEGDVFPLVIQCESSPSEHDMAGQSSRSSHAQITLAVIEKNNVQNFKVKVIKQVLWIDGERYELQDIFGLANSAETNSSKEGDTDSGKECVICLTEPRDTAVLPCRHMCMCSDCAKTLRFQTNKCPICRQPIEKLMEIKVNKGDP